MNKLKFNYAWMIFIGCCFLSFVGFGIVVNTHGLYFAPLAEELDLNKTQLGLTITFQGFAAAITLIFAGKIMARVNTKLLLSVCVTIFGGGFILFSTFHSFIPFLIVWTIIGIAQAFALAVAIPVLIGNWFEKKMGLAMGISLGISGLGGAFFNPLISSIITNHGWRTASLLSGILLLICILPFTIFVFRYKPNEEKGEFPYGREFNASIKKIAVNEELTGLSAKEAYRTSPFYLYLITVFSLSMIAGLVQHVSGHIVNIGYTLTLGASVVSAIMLGAAVGKVFIGILLDILPANLVIVFYALFGIVGWGGLIWFSGEAALVASGFLLGVGQGIGLVGLPYFIRKTFGSKEFAQIYSIISMVGAFAASISATLGGVLFDKTGSFTISISSNVVFYAIASVSLLLGFALKRKLFAAPNEINSSKIV